MMCTLMVTVLLVSAGGMDAAAAAAVEPSAVAVAATATAEEGQTTAAAPLAATSVPSACVDEVAQILSRVITCNYGVPRCTWNGQCDSWCGSYGAGYCSLGCCACIF